MRAGSRCPVAVRGAMVVRSGEEARDAILRRGSPAVGRRRGPPVPPAVGDAVRYRRSATRVPYRSVEIKTRLVSQRAIYPRAPVAGQNKPPQSAIVRKFVSIHLLYAVIAILLFYRNNNYVS